MLSTVFLLKRTQTIFKSVFKQIWVLNPQRENPFVYSKNDITIETITSLKLK